MNIYRAVGRRTDIAGQPTVSVSGCTPKDARERLMRKYMCLTDVYTELIPREERYAMHRKERAS